MPEAHEADDPTAVGVDTQSEAPADVNVDAGQADAGATPEVTYFDPTAYADHLVKLPDGSEVKVADLPNGYLRQSDYTRKTQELAQVRTLQQALQNNPQQTLAFLAQQYGVDLAPAPASEQTPTEGSEGEGWEENDPVVRRLAALEARYAPIEQTYAQQRLDQTLEQLGARYGDAFDQNEVLNAALQMGVSDVGQLEAVFKLVAFDKVLAAQQARAEAANQAAADEAARTAGKAELGSTITATGGVAAGSTTPGKPAVNSIRDAWELAKVQHGVTTL